MTERKRPSGGQATATARQRARTARLAEKGLKKVPVIVPTEKEPEIKDIARQMREAAQHTESNT
jgi:hypothetical protein